MELLNDCTVKERSVNPNDENCLRRLQSLMYLEEDARFIASGVSGAAVEFTAKIFNPPTRIVVKYGLYLRDDIKQGCVNNRYVAYTPLFIRTYGFIRCRTIPQSWLPSKRALSKMRKGALQRYLQQLISFKKPPGNEKQSLTFLFMQNAGDSLAEIFSRNLPVDSNDIRCMSFDFLYGLMTARRLSGTFIHGDVHLGNVTASRLSEETQRRRYALEDSGIVFTLDSPWQLHLIDFGDVECVLDTSRTEDISNFFRWVRDKVMMTTIDASFQEFASRMMYMNNPIHQSNAVEPIKDVLQNDPYFKHLRVSKRQRILSCSICFRDTPLMCSSCMVPLCKQCSLLK